MKMEANLPINPIHKRDNYICQYCGRDGLASLDDWHNLTTDHFIPSKHGGMDEEKNLITCCHYCNLIKGKKVFSSLEEARKYILKRRAELGETYQKVRKTIKGAN